MKRYIPLLLLLCLQACKHPLAIVGEGDIVDRNNSRFGCTLEQFQAQDVACTENEVGNEDYIVVYEAVPRPGWQFVGWDGACDPVSVPPQCAFVSSEFWTTLWNDRFPDTTLPVLTAVFEREGQTLDPNGQVAGDLAPGAIDVYRLSIPGPGGLTLASSGSTDVQAALLLNDDVLAQNDDAVEGNINFEITYDVSTAGLYTLLVAGFSEEDSGPYTVTSWFESTGVPPVNYARLAPLDAAMKSFYVRWEERIGSGDPGRKGSPD